MTADPNSELFHPCSAESTVSHHGLRTRTDSGYGETEYHNTKTTQQLSNTRENNAVQTRSFNDAPLVRGACENTLFTEYSTRHNLQRCDSVTTSSGSSNKRRRNDGSSRRSSTQSARPSIAPMKHPEDPSTCYQWSISFFPNAGRKTSSPNTRTETCSAPCSPGTEKPKTSTSVVTEPVSPKTRYPSFSTATPNNLIEMEEEYEPVPATVIHWTSSQTRKKEYEEIDRLHSGMHGLWRKMAPKWLCPQAPAQFYDERRHSDAGSVRRHRLELPPEESESESESMPQQEAKKRPTISRSLSCF